MISESITNLFIPFVLGLSGSIFFLLIKNNLEKIKKERPFYVYLLITLLFLISIAGLYAAKYTQNIYFSLEPKIIKIPFPLFVRQNLFIQTHISFTSAISLSFAIMFVPCLILPFSLLMNRKSFHIDNFKEKNRDFSFQSPSVLLPIFTVIVASVAIGGYKIILYEEEKLLVIKIMYFVQILFLGISLVVITKTYNIIYLLRYRNLYRYRFPLDLFLLPFPHIFTAFSWTGLTLLIWI